jgi:hypothetical protein
VFLALAAFLLLAVLLVLLSSLSTLVVFSHARHLRSGHSSLHSQLDIALRLNANARRTERMLVDHYCRATSIIATPAHLPTPIVYSLPLFNRPEMLVTWFAKTARSTRGNFRVCVADFGGNGDVRGLFEACCAGKVWGAGRGETGSEDGDGDPLGDGEDGDGDREHIMVDGDHTDGRNGATGVGGRTGSPPQAPSPTLSPGTLLYIDLRHAPGGFNKALGHERCLAAALGRGGTGGDKDGGARSGTSSRSSTPPPPPRPPPTPS